MKITKEQMKRILPNLPVLRYGSRGDAVKELQRMLNMVGYGLKVDGIFGRRTLAAVRDFQKKNLLVVDGIVGVRTWSKLISKTGVVPLIAKLEEKKYKDTVENKPVKKEKKVYRLSNLEIKHNYDFIEFLKILSPFLIFGGILLLSTKK